MYDRFVACMYSSRRGSINLLGKLKYTALLNRLEGTAS